MEKQRNSERMIFLVVFAGLSGLFNRFPPFSDMNRLLVSGMLSGMGGIIGFMLYNLVSGRNNSVKYGSLAAVSLIILGCFFFIRSYYQKREVSEKKNPMELLTDAWKSEMQKTLLQPLDTSRFTPPNLTEKERALLITCEVCGYKALHPDSADCYNCWSTAFEKDRYAPDNKTEWLKNEQLKTFYPDEQTGKVNFYEPKIEEGGFKKDSRWKPSITEAEVIEADK